MKIYAYGFPRLGENREFKKYVESFWKEKVSQSELYQNIRILESRRLSLYKEYGADFPLSEMTLYDQMLDQCFMFGVCPHNRDLRNYFDFARGKNALEMKKFFNTNYHYLVPRIRKNTVFSMMWNKPLEYYRKFNDYSSRVYLIGPFTFLKLSRFEKGVDLWKKLEGLLKVYRKLFSELEKEGVESVHLDEPGFVLEIPLKEFKLVRKLYGDFFSDLDIEINIFTYYESVDHLGELLNFPLKGVGLDFVYGEKNLKVLESLGFKKGLKLFCGIIDGRSPGRCNILEKKLLVEKILAVKNVSGDNLILANSCPLYHLPWSLEREKKLPANIKNRLSFAREKLYELKLLSDALQGKNLSLAKKWSKYAPRTALPDKKVLSTLTLKPREFLKRRKIQDKILKLPLFPTTTIGSFPQDEEVRKIRALYRKRKIPSSEYRSFINKKIFYLVKYQEEKGLDVLVHGEFERTDMVEFFAQKLSGFATTDGGWVISYGTRVYRPPIIYALPRRHKPLTMREILYAQSLTPRPVKGMLTGPTTILNWSYNVSGYSSSRVAYALGRALNQEVKDLSKKGIKIIQIDEPAFREGVPLKRDKAKYYFTWAVRSFNLASRVKPQVQIHTHMCYSEFGEILPWILKLNFDVITIEAVRSKGRIIDDFRRVKFRRQIGPGVWDIHSVKIPAVKEMKSIIERALKVLGPRDLWINPDCGLKTRSWDEVGPSLENMVSLARMLREKYNEG